MTSAEVGHDALVNLSREEAFQAADDVAFGPARGEASGDVVAGRLVELHPDDDGSIEGRVGVSVSASVIKDSGQNNSPIFEQFSGLLLACSETWTWKPPWS